MVAGVTGAVPFVMAMFLVNGDPVQDVLLMVTLIVPPAKMEV
jgi:hypothetical protein